MARLRGRLRAVQAVGGALEPEESLTAAARATLAAAIVAFVGRRAECELPMDARLSNDAVRSAALFDNSIPAEIEVAAGRLTLTSASINESLSWPVIVRSCGRTSAGMI